jgi:hypothetical protein
MAQETGNEQGQKQEQEQGKQSSAMEETHQGQATSVTADAEKQDEQAFEPTKPQKSNTSESKKGPEGGYDDTPLPRREVHAPALAHA